MALTISMILLAASCVPPPESATGLTYSRYRLETPNYSYWSIETTGDGTSPAVRLRIDGVGVMSTEFCVEWSFVPQSWTRMVCRPVVTFPGSSQYVEFSDPNISGPLSPTVSAMAVYVRAPVGQEPWYTLAAQVTPVNTTGFRIRFACANDCG